MRGTRTSGSEVRAGETDHRKRQHRAPVRPYTFAWMNGYGRLRRCTERDAKIVDFYLHLAAAFVVVRRLIQQARTRYRWATRPTTKRLK
jgi:hypothetical protein